MREASASDQTYLKLRTELRHGVFGSGARLPSERALAAQFGVSRVTVRNGLSRLAEEGFVESIGGSGWFSTPQVVGEPPSGLQSFTEMARSRGLRPTSKILGQLVRPAKMSEADQLGIAPAANVLEIKRLRGMDETVICLDSTILPLSIAGGLEHVDLRDQSIYEQLQSCCNLRVARSSYSVRAEVADSGLADLLEIEVGWPILVGEEVGFVENAKPVLLGLTRYRGDSYRFQADLFRPSDSMR